MQMTMVDKLIAISGGFDPIHIGHIRLIKAASELGSLVIILNTDEFLMRKKGYVFMPLAEREEVLENIKGVGRVVVSIDEDDSVSRTLELVKPAIFANGGDRDSAKEIREAAVCSRLGIQMIFDVGGGKIQSSSDLIHKAKVMQ